MFWDVWNVLFIINIVISIVSFLCWVICEMYDTGKRHPKIPAILNRIVLVSMIFTLVMFASLNVHRHMGDMTSGQVYHVELDEDTLTVTGENGKKAIFILED